jgi:hypothetical protein
MDGRHQKSALIAEREKFVDGQDIERLLGRNIAAIWVRGFYPPTWAQAIGERLIVQSEPYANAPNVRKAKQQSAFYESVGNPELRRVYLDRALSNLREARQICEPYPHPIDLVRVAIDEVHRGGLRVLQHRDGPMFAGLLRVFGPGAGAEPHCDDLLWDDGGELFPHIGRGGFTQIAGNVYAKVPDDGGELHIWNLEPDRAAHDRRRDPASSYGLRVDDLGEPAIKIKPRGGDLVLFRSSCIHAVSTCGDWRAAASFFLVSCGQDLFIYS